MVVVTIDVVGSVVVACTFFNFLNTKTVRTVILAAFVVFIAFFRQLSRREKCLEKAYTGGISSSIHRYQTMIKINSKWLLEYKIHFLVWAIFIAYETVVIGLVFGIFGNPITYLLHYIVIVIFFYAWSDFGFPWAFERKRVVWWWRLTLAFLLAQSLYIVFHYLADLVLIGTGIISNKGPYPLSYQFILKNLYRGTYFLGFSTGYCLLKMRDLERRERERLTQLHFEHLLKQQEIEKELSSTQNAFLKAQINPHFLFNTLDFVYHSIPSHPEAAAEAVIYLSRMMRFAIDSNEQGEFVRIDEEIRHVQTLMHLYHLRNKNFQLPEINYALEIGKLNLIPLVILTLVENMIKHGRFNVPGTSAYLKLEIIDGLFVVETKNIIDRQTIQTPSGAGLKNIEKRLKFAYGEAVGFKYVADDAQHFILRITIPEVLLRKAIP